MKKRKPEVWKEFNPFISSRALKFHPYSGRPFKVYVKNAGTINKFFTSKQAVFHDSFLEQVLGYMSGIILNFCIPVQ
jgi:hypothetical protein